jgi:hypothetical protein
MDHPMNYPKNRECPHCHERLTIKEIIVLMHGDGGKHLVPVVFPEGVCLMEAGEINPLFAKVVDTKDERPSIIDPSLSGIL